MSFSTVDEAERAINEMNGFVIEGKHLKVQKKKEKWCWKFKFINRYQNQFAYPIFPYSGL